MIPEVGVAFSGSAYEEGRRLARYSAGWRARRPVPSRICSLQLVPGATTTLSPAPLTAGKSLLSPIFIEMS